MKALLTTAAIILTTTFSSALTEAQVFTAMKNSIAADEFGYEVGAGGRHAFIVDIREKHIKRMWTLKHEMPAKIDSNDLQFYYGHMEIKPSLLGGLRRVLARITPEGEVVGWLIFLKKNADGTDRYTHGLTSRSVGERYKAYERKINEQLRLEAEAEEEDHRRSMEQIAEKKRLAKIAADEARLADAKNNAKPLTDIQKLALNLALKTVYKRNNLVLDYLPGTLKTEALVADIERWTFSARERGKTNEITVTFDVEMEDVTLGLQTRVQVSKVVVRL